MAAFMACKGTLDGQQLMSLEAYEDMMSEHKEECASGIGLWSNYSKGGVN